MRRLAILNLGAAAAVALFGAYAWRLGIHSRRITLLHRTWTTKNGQFHEFDVFHPTVVHPHAALAFTAWGISVLVAAISVRSLRRQRSGADHQPSADAS